MPAGLRSTPTPVPEPVRPRERRWPWRGRRDACGTKAPVRLRERRWPFPPRLAAAFLAATLFHLSMVTVFRIVVVFPETRAKYCQLQIFSEAPPAPARVGNGGLRLGKSYLLAQAPETQVELPTLNFAELDRLRVRSEAGTDPAALERIFPTDSWARFAGGLQSIGQSLRKLAFPETPAAPEKVRLAVAKHHPAAGYNGEIVWDAEPRDRELLFNPPIPLLAEAANAKLRWPIEMVLTVTPAGRVVSAFFDKVDDVGVIEAVQRAALQYRFAPLPADSAGETGAAANNQMGTLSIRPAEQQP